MNDDHRALSENMPTYYHEVEEVLKVQSWRRIQESCLFLMCLHHQKEGRKRTSWVILVLICSSHSPLITHFIMCTNQILEKDYLKEVMHSEFIM